MMKNELILIPSPLTEVTNRDWLSPLTALYMKELRYFLVENVRSARRFISSMKLGIEIEKLHFSVLDKNTDWEDLPELMIPLSAGNSMGVISEAGCPGVADPGALAARYAHTLGCRVIPLTGPSGILLALMGSGLNGQNFTFNGYLPVDKQERIRMIRTLESISNGNGSAQIFMETPYRNDKLLQDVINTCQKETWLCIGANLTSPEQFLRTQRIADWKKDIPGLNKIPAIFIIQSGVFP